MFPTFQQYLKFFAILILSFFSQGCTPFNRMTSPEVLPKEERSWTVAAVVDPLTLVGGSIFGVQPVVGYRTGLGARQELGVTMYGIFFPAAVVDYKHQWFHQDKFVLAGDLAAYGGPARPVGLQYDLLFGNSNLYGVAGVNYHFIHEWTSPYGWQLGLGSEFNKNGRFYGLQLAYAHGLPQFKARNEESEFHGIERMLTIGLKFDFIKIKKKYRSAAENR